MATTRQKRAIQNLVESGGTSVSKAMRDAGYPATTAKNPKKLTESKAWIELMEQYFPDGLLAQKHRDLLNKQEVVVKNNNKTGEIEVIPTGELDPQAVAKGLDMAYKLKGKYAKNEEPPDSKSIFAVILTQIQNGTPPIVRVNSEPVPGSEGANSQPQQPLLETQQSILDQR